MAKNTQINYKTTLKQLLEFANSKEGVSFSIDDLIAEAKTDVKKTQTRIDRFYRWLQNEGIEGYKQRGKTVKIVYKESPNAEPYTSLGIVKDANPSFVVVRGHDGLTHFIATDTIVRISERFSEKR